MVFYCYHLYLSIMSLCPQGGIGCSVAALRRAPRERRVRHAALISDFEEFYACECPSISVSFCLSVVSTGGARSNNSSFSMYLSFLLSFLLSLFFSLFLSCTLSLSFMTQGLFLRLKWRAKRISHTIHSRKKTSGKGLEPNSNA